MVLESANFQASSIRKTSSAIKLRTDASMRFEKAQDPANTVRGLARAIELLREVSPGIRLVGGVADRKRRICRRRRSSSCLSSGWRANWAARSRRPRCARFWSGWSSASRSRGRRLLGDRALLARHQGHLHEGRPGGGSRAHGRVRFDRAASAAGRRPPCRRPIPERKFQHEVRNIFVDQGFTEVYNYSFLSEEAVRAFGMDPAAHVRVTNPIASDQALLRTSLLPGIWQQHRGEREASRELPAVRDRAGDSQARRRAARRGRRTWSRRFTSDRATASRACSRSSARPSA